MTNASAMTALKSLTATNKALEQTQSRISTGYRVAEAADNAAYWSISTTMRSDNKALSTVKDALGLGQATVDVAYTALNSAKSVLDDIKTKLVAAKQPNVDKAKVQSEIAQLQQQLVGIASSASFSGSNWLSVDSSAASYTSVQQVVSSFARSEEGVLSIGTISIDISKVALFDAGAGAGLLEAGVGNSSAAGLAAATSTGGAAASAATAGGFTTGAISLTGLAATDQVSLTFTVDGTAAAATPITIGADLTAFAANITAANLGFTATVEGGNRLKFTSSTTGTSSNVSLTTIGNYKDSGGTDLASQPTTGLATATGTAGAAAGATPASAGTATAATFSAITLDADDTLSFSIAVDGGAAKKVTINKATVDAALGTTDGAIGTNANLAMVLTSALSGASVSGVTVATNGSGVRFTSGTTGASSSVALSGITASNGGSAFNLTSIDITNASASDLDSYINGIDQMAEKVTTAASDLGAAKKRIGLQTDFVKNLMDAIDRGVGQLIDADMNEESTRLQALQVQQQLGTQALSIANGNSQGILRLFQS